MKRHLVAVLGLIACATAAAEELDPAGSAPRSGLRLRVDEAIALAQVIRTEPLEGQQPPDQVPQTQEPQEVEPFPSEPSLGQPPPVSSPQPKPSYFSRMTGWQWFAIGATVVATGLIAAGASGGGDEPTPSQSGAN